MTINTLHRRFVTQNILEILLLCTNMNAGNQKELHLPYFPLDTGFLREVAFHALTFLKK